MRIPVYARGANPRVDRPIQHKNLSYGKEAVEMYGSAVWVDPADPSKGIICRDFLYFGEKTVAPPTPEQLRKLRSKLKSALPPLEPNGCKFIPPPMEKNPTLPRLNLAAIELAADHWDWATA